LRAAAALACKQKDNCLTSFDGFCLNEAIMRAIAEEKNNGQREQACDWSGGISSVAFLRRPAPRREQTWRTARSPNKDGEMTKEELLQFEGLVTEILPDARYRVQLDAGHMVVVYTAGRMKRNRIKTLAGDRVTVEISPYDLDKGRMIFRHKDERAGSGGRPAQRHHFRRR
jgi:translation initiation factor IF-1